MMARNSKLCCWVISIFSLCFFFVTMSVMAQCPDYAGYWNLNGKTLDFSGNDNNGTITGTENWTTAGKAGKAFNFNGNTYIDCGTDSSLSISDNISIEFWFYPEQWVAGYAAYPISKWTSTTDANYVMYFFGNTAGSNYKKIGFLANAGGVWRQVSPYYLIPTLNTWYHIVWTYNSVNGGKLYVNGTLQGSISVTGTLAENVADLKLGMSVAAPGFTGILDEVKIYNKVLALTEVQQKYQDVQTRGSWNFNGNSLDFSGNDNNGTITGTENWTTAGKVGKAFNFNGNTYIDCGTDSSLSISDNISIEFWFYPEQWVAGYAAYPISKWTSTTDANYVMYFFGNTAGSNYKKIGFLANAGGVWRQVSPYYLIPTLNTWYHIVWTYNSVNGGKLYVNGTLQGSISVTGTLAENVADLRIGSGFNGFLDEARIYNRGLDALEVLTRYQDLGVAGTVLENNTLRLTVNSSGKITELYGKPTGYSYSGGTVDFAKVKKSGVWYSSSSCLQKDGRLIIDFGSANVTAEIATKIKDSYLVFQIYSVYGDTSGLEQLQLLNINPPLYTYGSSFIGIKSDNNFAVGIRAMNAKAWPTNGYSVFPGVCYTKYGLALAKFGLWGSTRSNIRTVLQSMIINEGLPGSSKGGPWALDTLESQYSYMFTYDMTASNVSQYIALAQNSGIKIFNFYNWWQTAGHYPPKTSLYPNGLDDIKACVDAIHAAGLLASMHCMTGAISVTDSYVTPVPDARLRKDAQFTLSSAITSTATTIGVNEQPLSSMTGKLLKIDNELVSYTGYTTSPPYQFTGCTRGAWSTTKTAHNSGATASHLYFVLGWYVFADPDSTLMNELASNLANAANYCGFDMVYLDNNDYMTEPPYAEVKYGTAIFNRIGRDVRIEASGWFHQHWPFYSNLGASDYPCYGIKKFIERHATNISYSRSCSFLPTQLGWWFILGYDTDTYSQLPDELELLCARALGHDAALSFVSVNPNPVNKRQSEYLQMIKAYEDLRLAGTVPESVKSQLRASGNEFHLTQTGSIIQRDNLTQKITGLSDGSNSWTVNNRFSVQSAKFRIQVLHSAYAAYYDDANSGIVLDNFQTVNFTLTNAANVTSDLTVNNGICTYTATNNTATPVGAWTKASKTFSPLLNTNGYDSIGVWVNGDGRGEVLNFQLYQTSPTTAYDEHYVVVNFSGWRYFELFLRERDADKYLNYTWPYGSGNYYELYRNILARNSISNLNIYYNNLPVGQQVSCEIKPVKALPTANVGITNPSVSIGGTVITFLVTLQSGQYIEFNSMTDCKHYDADGAFIANVTPTGTLPTLNAGSNDVIFTGTGPAGYNVRANVTMFIDGGIIY